MENLVYLVAEFSSEFLLIFALLIFILVCIYAGFWILKKRRYGVIESHLPAGPVKAYLNEMIFNAEQLRAQLFGLLGQPLPQAHTSWATAPVQHAPSGDPGKLGELEGKLAEQLKALESLTQAKTQLEQDLADAKLKINSQAGPGQNNAELKKMDDKIKLLESRLAEYNVIEDDLANLKRFQQENVQLRKALAAAGVSSPSSSPGPKGGEPPAGAAPASGGQSESPAPPAEAPAEPLGEPEATPAMTEEDLAVTEEPKTASPSQAPVAKAEVDSSSDDAFSQLTQQVSKEMKPPARNDVEGDSVVPEPNVPSPIPAGGAGDKSEEDLVAEFEKMLKG